MNLCGWLKEIVYTPRIINIFGMFIFFMVFDVFSKDLLEIKENNPKSDVELEDWKSKLRPAELPPSQKALDAVWQPVADTKYAFYVYSAFIERRKRLAVRVIGATKATTEDRVFCRLWLPDNRSFVLQAEVHSIKEDHNRYNGAVFISCLLHNLKPDETVGGAIAVMSSSSPRRSTTNLLKVMDTRPKSGGEENIHVCVRPLHGSYNDVEWMVEWIELNRILGASHFYFYNMSMGDRIDCMLRNYQNNKELFNLLSFQLPPLNLWGEGQLVASHDCLYRSMTKADWLLIIDLDEIVVPHNNGVQILQQREGGTVKPFPAMFDLLAADSNVDPYAFVFRNSFFYQGWEDDPKAPAPLFTARKTRRMEHTYWYGIRSKYAVRPSKVIELGVHNIEEFEFGAVRYNSFNVDSDKALLHHYRRECVEIQCYELYTTKIDRAAWRWTKRLWRRVQERLRDIEVDCRQKE